MVRSWSSLPTEILLLIFEHLGKSSDVDQCQLTCKNWGTSAQQRLYSNVELLGDSYAISFLQSIQNSSLDLGARHLVSRKSYFCPNVQVFILGKYSVNRVWSAVINELSQGRWHSIKHIPLPQDKSDMDEYSKVVLERRSILNSLTIWISRGKTANNLVGNLSAFISLTHLDVRIEQSLEISDLETVFNSSSYSQLEKITYNTFYSVSGPRRATFRYEEPENTNQLSLVSPFPNVKIFEAGRIVFADKSLSYLMHKFPNLDRLTLKEDGFIRNRPELSASVVNAFLQYITKIKELDIAFTTTENIPVVINKFLQPVFYGSFLKLKLSYPADDDNFMRIDPYIKIRNQSLYKTNFIKYNSFEDKADDDSELGYTRDEDIIVIEDPPTVDWIYNSFEDRLEELELSLSQTILLINEEGGQQYAAASGKRIADIMERCRSTKTLTINAFTLYECNPDRYFTNNSIQILEFKDCYINQNTFPLISVRLVSLKNLKITYCTHDQEEWNRNLYIDMPNSSLENIHWKENGMDKQLRYSYTNIYLMVSSADGVKYFVLYGENWGMRESSHLEFSNKRAATHNDILSNDCTMHIRCKEIKSITTEFDYYGSFKKYKKMFRYLLNH